MYRYQEKRSYGTRKGFVDSSKMDRETRAGIQKLKGDVRVGGKWLAGKAKKEYKKFKTLRGSRIYEYIDGDFVRYTVVFQDGSMHSMSENPLSLMGYHEYLGNTRKDKSLKPFGKKIDLEMVPWEVRRTIKKIAEGSI